MARYIADVKYIASIYPGELPIIRRAYGPSQHSNGAGGRSSKFELQPVKRGKKPFVIEVCDCFEDVLDLAQIGANVDKKGQKPRLPKPVPVETIVADLLNHWTGGLYNVPAGARPGIMEVVNSAPSQAELKEMEGTQTLYFEYLFTEGERLHKENNWKDITETMRLAAVWLGYPRVWSDRSIAQDSGPCPACGAIMPNFAAICQTCRTIVRPLPPDIAKLQGVRT